MPKVAVEGKLLELKNLDKPFWPEGFTKGDLIRYYDSVAPYLLPHLKDRPLVLNRFPDGIEGEHFYQKECPDYAPDWVKTVPVENEHLNGNRPRSVSDWKNWPKRRIYP